MYICIYIYIHIYVVETPTSENLDQARLPRGPQHNLLLSV